MTWSDVNLNEVVRVKLTDRGRTVHKLNHETLIPGFPYKAPREDSEGWSEFQLWELMAIFGRCMGNGFPLVLETTIQVKPREKATE